jgi:hypothetical protein
MNESQYIESAMDEIQQIILLTDHQAKLIRLKMQIAFLEGGQAVTKCWKESLERLAPKESDHIHGNGGDETGRPVCRGVERG